MRYVDEMYSRMSKEYPWGAWEYLTCLASMQDNLKHLLVSPTASHLAKTKTLSTKARL